MADTTHPEFGALSPVERRVLLLLHEYNGYVDERKLRLHISEHAYAHARSLEVLGYVQCHTDRQEVRHWKLTDAGRAVVDRWTAPTVKVQP